MVTYEELAILPHQKECGGTYCAMCGRKLWYVNYEGCEWQYCRKCKVIKSYYCEDEYPKVKFKFWSNEDD